jgi:hypothetical protein
MLENAPASLRIRHHAAEQLKRLHRLKHRHVAAIQRAAAQGAGVAQQFGFQREVHDLRDPQLLAQQLHRHRHARQFGHAHRRGVHQTIGLIQRTRQIEPAPRDLSRNAG